MVTQRSDDGSEGPIPVLSRFLCRIIPNCSAETISAEIAERLNTTTQGAHMWMIGPYLNLGGLSIPLRKAAEAFTRFEVRNALAEHGPSGLDEMLRFIPRNAPIRPEIQAARQEAQRQVDKAVLGQLAFTVRRSRELLAALRKLKGRVTARIPAFRLSRRQQATVAFIEALRFEAVTGSTLPDAPQARAFPRERVVGLAEALAALPSLTI